MSVQFDPSGQLDVATDPGDLPESAGGTDIASSALTRCKNLRINQRGQAKTRDGSAKINASAINATIWWIEEQGGNRYVFSGTSIYLNESTVASGLTSAQWSAIKYAAFNDNTQQIFALNGTDRKRIEGSTVYEWGIAAPTVAATLGVGGGSGLTGAYNAVYTYCRKVGDALVAESNPSPRADFPAVLDNGSLSVDVTQPADPQVTHIRVYRTPAGGELYYLDDEIEVNSAYSHGVSFDWEDTDNYISGVAFKWTTADATHSTENAYTWEEVPSEDFDNNPGAGSSIDTGYEWWSGYY
jgi:hypothetical protein